MGGSGRREEKQSDERQNHTGGLKKQIKNVLLLYVCTRHTFWELFKLLNYRLKLLTFFPTRRLRNLKKKEIKRKKTVFFFTFINTEIKIK